jgi:hypothetical protein
MGACHDQSDQVSQVEVIVFDFWFLATGPKPGSRQMGGVKYSMGTGGLDSQ